MQGKKHSSNQSNTENDSANNDIAELSSVLNNISKDNDKI